MRTIARLFGKSPFFPLQSHMKKVSSCIKKLTEIFDQFPKHQHGRIEAIAREVSELEHEADLTKNDIRNHLPRSLFLPIDQGQFLDILTIQDDLADKAEDIANLLTFKELQDVGNMKEHLQRFYKKACETFWDARKIMKEINELIESSFGGQEAEKVKRMVEATSYKEHEADVMKRDLLKKFFGISDQLSPTDFYLWINLIEEIGALSHISERLANRIRMILELK
ncbi:MAG: TIGR00153 family protein [Simkaniaceae bacterium]